MRFKATFYYVFSLMVLALTWLSYHTKNQQPLKASPSTLKPPTHTLPSFPQTTFDSSTKNFSALRQQIEVSPSPPWHGSEIISRIPLPFHGEQNVKTRTVEGTQIQLLFNFFGLKERASETLKSLLSVLKAHHDPEVLKQRLHEIWQQINSSEIKNSTAEVQAVLLLERLAIYQILGEPLSTAKSLGGLAPEILRPFKMPETQCWYVYLINALAQWEASSLEALQMSPSQWHYYQKEMASLFSHVCLEWQ